MVVSESRWRVVRVVHIYNPAYSLNHLDHHGRRTTPALQAFGLPPIQKKNKLTPVSRIAHCFVASTHVTLVNLIAPPPLWKSVYAYINSSLLSQ